MKKAMNKLTALMTALVLVLSIGCTALAQELEEEMPVEEVPVVEEAVQEPVTQPEPPAEQPAPQEPVEQPEPPVEEPASQVEEPEQQEPVGEPEPVADPAPQQPEPEPIPQEEAPQQPEAGANEPEPLRPEEGEPVEEPEEEEPIEETELPEEETPLGLLDKSLYKLDENGNLLLDENGAPILLDALPLPAAEIPDEAQLLTTLTDALDPNRSIDIYYTFGGGELHLGDRVTLYARLHGYDNAVYTLQWQTSGDAGSWSDIPGETGLSYTLTLDKGNYTNFWRIAVLISDVVVSDTAA